MIKTEIGGRPVDITKEDDKIKIVFHPEEIQSYINGITYAIKKITKVTSLEMN